ncbi:MAG: M48 family metallopeptidase [Thermodesulfobacteriota bacterium]
MGAYISPDEFRINGEKTALYWGFGILGFILLFVTTMSVGILTVFLVGATAIIVWIQQSQLLGQSARVSEKQFPEIYAIAKETSARLGMQQPDVFIKQDPTLNAFAIGFLGKKSVVLHSATVEAMDKEELQHIIGHEFSHIKCGHTNLTVLTSSQQAVKVPIISQILSFVFLFWSRKAEYTSDRGGVIACRDSKAAISAMCKLAVGPALFKQMDVNDFLNQQMALDQNDIAKLSENLGTHPYLVKRVHAVQKFFDSTHYMRLVSKNS